VVSKAAESIENATIHIVNWERYSANYNSKMNTARQPPPQVSVHAKPPEPIYYHKQVIYNSWFWPL